MLVLDLSNPATFERNLVLLDARIRGEASKAQAGLVDLAKVVTGHNEAAMPRADMDRKQAKGSGESCAQGITSSPACTKSECPASDLGQSLFNMAADMSRAIGGEG